MAPATAPTNDTLDLDELLKDEPIPDEEGIDTGTPTQIGSDSGRADLAGAVGGIAGAQLGGPVIPARGMGALIGGAAGHLAGSVSQDLEQGGLPQATANFTKNLTEAAKTGLLQGSAEMALPVVGQVGMAVPGVKQGLQRLGGAVASKIGEWVLPKMSPAVEGMQKRLVKEGSPGLTAAQRLDPTRGEEAKFVQLGENLAYHAWFGGPLKNAYEVNEAAANQAFDRFVTTMQGLSPKDFEGTARQVLTGRIKQNMFEPMDKIYDNIRQRAPGNIVEATALLKELRNPNSKMGNLVIGGLKNIRESAQNPGEIDRLIKLLDTPKKGAQTQTLPKLTLDQALRLKTQLNQLAEGPTGTDPDVRVMAATAGRLASGLDKQIQSGLSTAQINMNDPGLLRTYTNASATYARLADKYQNQFVQKVIKAIDEKPGTLGHLLMPSSLSPDMIPAHQEMVKAVKAAYGPRWNTEIRPLLAATLGNRALDETGKYSGVALARNLQSYGSDLLDQMLGPKTGQALMDHARTLEHVAERPKGTGSVAIQLMQASALSGAAGAATGFALTGDVGTAVKGGTVAILVAPWVLGHLYGNPTWIRAMDKGLLQFRRSGKPPGILLTTLRQAAAVAGKPTFEAALTTEPPPSFIDRTLPNRPEPTKE